MNLHITKSKNAESFYIAKSYTKANGKTSSVIVRKLGTLNQLIVEHGPTRDDVLAWAKNEVKLETEKYKKDQQTKAVQITFHSDHKLDYGQQVLYRGGYLFPQTFYYRLKLDNICRKPFWPRLSTQNLIEHSPEEDWYNKNATEVRKSTYFMRECRFLRCTSLELAYNMPKKLMERWGLQNMKFFVRANNPFLISNFKLWDVELGEDAFNYPIQKTYTVGLNFSF